LLQHRLVSKRLQLGHHFLNGHGSYLRGKNGIKIGCVFLVHGSFSCIIRRTQETLRSDVTSRVLGWGMGPSLMGERELAAFQTRFADIGVHLGHSLTKLPRLRILTASQKCPSAIS